MRNRFLLWAVLSISGVVGCGSASDDASDGEYSGDLASSSRFAGSAGSSARSVESAPKVASATIGSTTAGSPVLPIPQASPSEMFDDVGTNPFVRAARDPFSTFAADVDTASYDVFRRNTGHNIAVDKRSVRVEEFVNYFEYNYPAPAESDEHPFSINTALAQNPFGRDTTLLRVGIQARMPDPEQRKPASLVFLVDTSGSMQSEDKLPLVQYLLTRTLDVLREDDKVAIVTYAGTTAVALPPTPVAAKSEISQVINSLNANGSTAGASGIQLAYAQAESAFREDGINHVILCTDGDFNVGISNTDELVALIKEKRQTGITLTALGFGLGNLNDAMMEKVSNAGNGMYSVITSGTQANRYAEVRMLRTFLHVAKDMKIQLEWNPSKVDAYRLIGYEDRKIADVDFRDDTVDAGEVGAGHRVTALYEVVLAGNEIPNVAGAPAEDVAEQSDNQEAQLQHEIKPEDLVMVKVRYKQPGASESDAASEVVVHTPEQDAPGFEDADPDLQYSASLAAFAEILKDSPFAAPSQLGLMRTVFSEQAEQDIERQEFLTLFDKAVTLLPAP